jgi:hypothetical protein
MDWAVDGLETAVRFSFGRLDGLDDRATTFDGDLALSSIHKKHDTALALVISCDDFDLIAFFDVCLDAAHGNEILEIRPSKNFGCERDDLHERTLTEFTGHRSKDPSAAWVVIFVNDDDCIGIETQH